VGVGEEKKRHPELPRETIENIGFHTRQLLNVRKATSDSRFRY